MSEVSYVGITRSRRACALDGDHPGPVCFLQHAAVTVLHVHVLVRPTAVRCTRALARNLHSRSQALTAVSGPTGIYTRNRDDNCQTSD
jgi:hypothetical protein